MGAKEKIIEAAKHFSGEKPAARIVLKSGREKFVVVVDFARLVLPEADYEEFGKTKPLGFGRVELTPGVAEEIVSEDGALCSGCEEHRKRLEEWFVENFPLIVRKMLGKPTSATRSEKAESTSPSPTASLSPSTTTRSRTEVVA